MYSAQCIAVEHPKMVNNLLQESRHMEERMMLADAMQWRNANSLGDTPHAKTGATALHVAAAKGYVRVMK